MTKKQIIAGMLTMFVAQGLMAEQSMSRLEHIETIDCSINQIKNVIRVSADRIMFAEKNLTVLEEALGLTTEDKTPSEQTIADQMPGASVDITGIRTQFEQDPYSKEVAAAEKAVRRADTGKVVIVEPRLYNIMYEIKNAGEKNKVGQIDALITCRIEKDGTAKQKADEKIQHSARLISFEIKK